MELSFSKEILKSILKSIPRQPVGVGYRGKGERVWAEVVEGVWMVLEVWRNKGAMIDKGVWIDKGVLVERWIEEVEMSADECDVDIV